MIHNFAAVEKYRKYCPLHHGLCSSVYFVVEGMYIPGNLPVVFLRLFPSEFQYAVYTEDDGYNPITIFNIKSNIIAN